MGNRILYVALASLFISAFAAQTIAQETVSPIDAVSKPGNIADRTHAIEVFAEDLSKLQEMMGPGFDESGVYPKDAKSPEKAWRRALEEAREFRDRWNDNPFVEIDGFSISLSTSPGINVQFRFKDGPEATGSAEKVLDKLKQSDSLNNPSHRNRSE